jgi:hypothetical protein
MPGLQVSPGTAVIRGIWCPRCMLNCVVSVMVPMIQSTPQAFSTLGPFLYCEGCRGCPS